MMRQTGSNLFARREPLRQPPAPPAKNAARRDAARRDAARRDAAPRVGAAAASPHRRPLRRPPRAIMTARRSAAYAELGETVFSASFIPGLCAGLRSLPLPSRRRGRTQPRARRHVGGGPANRLLLDAAIHRPSPRGGGRRGSSRASPGFANLLWRRPVLAGDRISYSTQVIASADLQAGPGTGPEPQPRRQPARRTGDGFHRRRDHADGGLIT